MLSGVARIVSAISWVVTSAQSFASFSKHSNPFSILPGSCWEVVVFVSSSSMVHMSFSQISPVSQSSTIVQLSPSVAIINVSESNRIEISSSAPVFFMCRYGMRCL